MKLFFTICRCCVACALFWSFFQSGKSAGLSGAIGGVADSFLAKNKAKTDRRQAGACHKMDWCFIPGVDLNSADYRIKGCV